MYNIAQWQAEARARPKVWAVFERYQNEESLCEVYDTKEAADLHSAWLSSPERSVRSKTVVRPLTIMNMKLAVDRFSTPMGKGDGAK